MLHFLPCKSRNGGFFLGETGWGWSVFCSGYIPGFGIRAGGLEAGGGWVEGGRVEGGSDGAIRSHRISLHRIDQFLGPRDVRTSGCDATMLCCDAMLVGKEGRWRGGFMMGKFE